MIQRCLRRLHTAWRRQWHVPPALAVSPLTVLNGIFCQLGVL